MRYLRMLSNSVFGGALATAYLTLLMLLMNPGLPLTTRTVPPLAAALALSYGVHVAALLYAAYVVRQIVAVQPLSPGWISLRLVTWSSALLAAVEALIAWLNAREFRTALEPEAVAALLRSALTLALCAAALLIVALAHSTMHGPSATRPIATSGRGRRAVAWVFVIIVSGSIAVPLGFRGWGLRQQLPGHRLSVGQPASAPASPRLFLLLLEGASLDVISPAVAEGRLPHFGRLMDAGASLHLATVRPTQPEPVWASMATGKWPPKHGIRSSGVYWARGADAPLTLLPDYSFAQALLRYGFLSEKPHPASALGARPLWQMLSSHGVSSGIVGVPLTHPPEPIHGFIVSDRFHRSSEPRAELDDRPAVYPLDAAAVVGESLRASTFDSERIAPIANALPDGANESAALRADRVYHDAAARLSARRDVTLLVVRYQGLDALGHYYLRFARPESFGDVSEAEQRRFGQVLEDYYGYIDSIVGEAVASLRGDDLLLVVSGFGMEPLSPGNRLIERLVGDERFSGTHEAAPDGFLLAFGSAVARGRASRGALVDVTPTVLYFLGLPVARDMDGFARTDIFTRAFNAQRTITFIPSYE